MAETRLYNQVFYYLRDNQYPEGCTKDQKRNRRKKAQKFILDDGALFFVANENSPPKRWVHDKEEQERVLVMPVTQTNLLDTSVATKLEKRFVKFTLIHKLDLIKTSEYIILIELRQT